MICPQVELAAGGTVGEVVLTGRDAIVGSAVGVG
jgi:hypothetical protein